MGIDLKMNMSMANASELALKLLNIGLTNAASDPYGNEANSTAGFLSSGLSVFESQSVIVNVGTYAIHAETTSPQGRFYKALGGAITLGYTYRLMFAARHVGTGGMWSVGFTGWNGSAGGASPTNGGVDITSADTTWKTYQVDITSTSAGTNYIIAAETSPTNDGGIYLDNLAVYKLPYEYTLLDI
jgi:hypothetical protein